MRWMNWSVGIVEVSAEMLTVAASVDSMGVFAAFVVDLCKF